MSSYFGGQIHLFDPDTFESIGAIRGVPGAQTVVSGPTGEWIAVAELDDAIVRVDPDTFEVTGPLVADDPATSDDETGGLDNPDAAAFGPDGRLYVSSFETDQVLRYEADGTFVDVFVDAGVGGLDGPDIGLGFEPTGDLVVPGWTSDRVHRYDALTGAPLDDLVGPEDGLAAPRAVRFTADGVGWVTGHDAGGLLRVDPDTGAVTVANPLPRAAGLAIVGDTLLVSTSADDTVHAIDPRTGEDLGVRIDFRPIDGVTAIELLRR
ncbi:MAG: hypothetical protein ABMA64_35720 [Myxococcota bacterium]